MADHDESTIDTIKHLKRREPFTLVPMCGTRTKASNTNAVPPIQPAYFRR